MLKEKKTKNKRSNMIAKLQTIATKIHQPKI